MSLVMSLLTEDFAVMTGDLQATHIENHDITMNNVKKTYKLNNYVSLGVTGDLNVSIELLRYAKDNIKDKTTVQAAAQKFKRYLKGIQKEKPDMQQRIHVLGAGDNGRMVLIEMVHDDRFKYKTIEPKENEALWSVMQANVPATDIISQKFNALESHDYKAIAGMLQEVCEEVASKDNFVSKESTSIIIIKA